MDIEEVTHEINTIRSAVYANKYWQDGEVISQVIVKLALLNSFLGDKIAQAELDANTLESHYKSTRENRKLELMGDKLSATHAESQAYVETDEIRDMWNKSVYNYKTLQIKRQDTNNIIDGLRSRLSFMKADKEALKA